MIKKRYPLVGVGLLVIQRSPEQGTRERLFAYEKVLLRQRKGSHGAGEWSFPGGHLEYGETFFQCAMRELEEEAGKKIRVKNVRFLHVCNIQFYMPKHYVHVGLICEHLAGDPLNTDPDKGGAWGWYPLDDLPKPLFRMAEISINAYKTGHVYIDEAPKET